MNDPRPIRAVRPAAPSRSALTGLRVPLRPAPHPETIPPAADAPPLPFVQARIRAAREAADHGHALGSWAPGTAYPGGEQDWWATCQRCACLVWVVSRSDRMATVQHVPGRCRPPLPGGAAASAPASRQPR
ncbi:MAG TPA: hypothetical protein VGE42_08665 [Candidatus Dormibacteraeota bacterium]|jgi:hypothetical protein